MGQLIRLNKPNAYALVDNEIRPFLKDISWYLQNSKANGTNHQKDMFYIINRKVIDGKSVTRRLNRMVWEFYNGDIPKGHYVFHLNGNSQDCRIENLICSTRSNINKIRKKTVSDTSSKYKGVYKSSQTGRWVAHIGVNYKRYSLGTYEDEWDAAEAYNEAAIEFHGEMAVLNSKED